MLLQHRTNTKFLMRGPRALLDGSSIAPQSIFRFLNHSCRACESNKKTWRRRAHLHHRTLRVLEFLSSIFPNRQGTNEPSVIHRHLSPSATMKFVTLASAFLLPMLATSSPVDTRSAATCACTKLCIIGYHCVVEPSPSCQSVCVPK